VRPDQTPFRQFFYEEIPKDVIRRLEELKPDLNLLAEMDPPSVGQLIRNQKCGPLIASLVHKLPFLNVVTRIHPITRGIIRILLDVTCGFKWDNRYHGTAEPFWIWIEDGENEYIYHSEYFILLKTQMQERHYMDFTIPVREPLPPQYYVRIVSDKYVLCSSA
jgi:hypothetical protein